MEASLSRASFAALHRLLSQALLSRVDERTAAVIADCEWALYGGSNDVMTRSAFEEWAFQVLEAWSAETSVPALVSLAEELVEAVMQPNAPPNTLRSPEDIEWAGLVRPSDACAIYSVATSEKHCRLVRIRTALGRVHGHLRPAASNAWA